MRVAVAGAAGFIGRNLVQKLQEDGHEVIELDIEDTENESTEFYRTDFTKPETIPERAKNADAVYYLIHSMSARPDFEKQEQQVTENFRRAFRSVDQVIYLTGIHARGKPSRHLRSRREVGEILSEGDYNYTELRAGMIMGERSASYELMRDLVEKLPVMLTPRWLRSKTQPIYVEDAIDYLVAVLGNENCFDTHYDIGGPDILSYEQMLRDYAEIRGLNRLFVPVPLLNPKLSAYWLRFITTQDYHLAYSLVQSLQTDLLVEKEVPDEIASFKPLGFRESVRRIESGEEVGQTGPR